MTEHKNIQDPKKYSKKDYEKFEYLLFAEDTPTEMLKDIAVQEIINEKIREGIKTERYKNLSTMSKKRFQIPLYDLRLD